MHRIIIATLAGVAVLACGLSCFRPVAAKSVPIGELAEKDRNFRGQSIRVTNAGAGVKAGRFLIFKMDSATRHHVVLVLSGEEVETGGVTCWAGICSGVRVTGLPGCPCPAPFVLVESAEPSTTTID